MPSNVAPPNNTGGKGFVFENDVCAWLLVSMLVGEPVLGVDCGPVVRLDFQARPDGWFLDDVLVTTSLDAVHHRISLSVKSNTQFTAISAPSDFVASAWEQLRLGTSPFDVTVDFMGLVTAPLSGAAAHAVSGLAEKARVNDPDLFPSRLATPSWANSDERNLFASFACPASLGQTTTDVDTARLLQRLRFIQRDFGAVVSESQNCALELCRRAVRSHTMADAQTLWSILRELASELRPQAGSLTLFDLVDRLRTRVTLADYPDHSGDWDTLDARSKREAGLVRASIADRIHLRRDEHVAGIVQLIADNPQVALLGASGVGKSALAKAAFEQRMSRGERTLWIDASSLDRFADFGVFETSLQLRHPLAELLAIEGSRQPVVVLDGLDRLHSDLSFRTVATLLQSVSGGPRTTKWRILAVCQSQEWQRVLEGIQSAGAPVNRWLTHPATALQPVELQPVRDAVPALARLLLQPKVGSLLTNLKLLDLVVRRLDGGTSIDPSSWVGESSVAEWFWTTEVVGQGPDRLARGKFARNLAQAQADQLAVSVSIDMLDASSLPAAQSLTVDQILIEVPGDRLSFAHDLYGDWSRLRILINHNHQADLVDFLQGRHESPLWHRAIRLLGIHLLESKNGIAEWRTLMASFSSGKLIIIRDLLLEAPAFSMNAGPLLERIFPDLVAENGELLRRLLSRFMAFATVPNERMQEIARALGVDANTARLSFRQPHWPYWLDVLAVLHAHRNDVVRTASCETAKLVEMWLEFVPPKSIRRREVAELAVMLGQRAVDSRDDWREREEHADRQRFYKCALLAAPERPDEVAHIAKVAAERIPRMTESVEESVSQPQLEECSIFGAGIMRGPWPDGPLARVDDDFQNVILEGQSIQHLYRERPGIAREVILAALIEAPYKEYWSSSRLQERDLDLVSRYDWLPTLYTQGPFLVCLRDNFAEGLELIMRLVEFATERSNESANRKLNEWRARATAEGRSDAEIDEVVKGATPQHLVLYDGTKEMRFSGDTGSYGWSAGLTCPQGYSPLPPATIAVALMALEQYFYLRLDAGDDITEEISSVLTRNRTVAILGVLCDIGKRQLSLFAGPLRSLLSAPELYSCEIQKLVQGRSHLMIGSFRQGLEFIKLAQRFHDLEHRKNDLRHIAVEQLLKCEEIKNFFVLVREWWKRRKADGEQLNDMVDQLDMRLDPANYQMREDPKHGLIIVNVALERVQVERSTEQQAINNHIFAITFPTRCRKILDEKHVQTDSQLEDFWQAWVQVRVLAKEDPALPKDDESLGAAYVHAIKGGIAVLLWHDEWLSRDTTRRQEIEDALESVLKGDLPERTGLTTRYDASTWTWDCFVAEAAAMLWARQPQDERWRELVARMVFSEKFTTIRLLFARCSEFRSTLGDDFGRLRRLVLDWAHMRDRIDVLRSMQHMDPPLDEKLLARLQLDLEGWTNQAISSFVDGSLPPPPVDWSKLEGANRFIEIDELRRRWPDYRLMDFHLVKCSHEWMPQPIQAQSPEERLSIVQFWRVALEVVTARPRADLQRRDQQYPHEDEVWVLQNVAAMVLQLEPKESPEYFWMAIIDLHSEAHDWPQQFLSALHRRALAADEPPATYAPLLRKIVQHAFTKVNGKLRWPGHEEVWDALLGIDYWESDLWSDRHAGHVSSIWDVISFWMENAPQEGSRLGKFARWLSKTAAAPIRLRVLPWFVIQIQPEKTQSVFRDKDPEDELAKLLNVIWEQDQRSLRHSRDQFSAFQKLLTWLAGQQNQLGLHLQNKIGSFG